MTYSEKLKDPRWQKKRLEILERDKFTCKKCDDTETTLHVHHLKYQKGKNPWEYNKKDLITLCEHCHQLIEEYKKIDGFEYNKCKIYKSIEYVSGDRILFCSFNNFCNMVIFDKDIKWILGYTLEENIADIIKILKVAQNG